MPLDTTNNASPSFASLYDTIPSDDTICALDPSFSNTGMAFLHPMRRLVLLDALKGDGRPHKRFTDIQESIASYTLPMLEERFLKEGVRHLYMEEPFPHGTFSAGLYALDTAIAQRFHPILRRSYNPRTLEHVIGVGRHTKEQSVSMALRLIDILRAHGYAVQWPKGKGRKGDIPCHDACEAFIYLMHSVLLDGTTLGCPTLDEDVCRDVTMEFHRLGRKGV